MATTFRTLSTALVIAIGAFATTAEAGSCGGGGYRTSYSRAPARNYSEAAYVKKAAKPTETAAKAPAVSKKTAVAEAERQVRSSVATATVAAIEPAATDKAAAIAEPAVAAVETAAVEAVPVSAPAARDLGCKRFIPAAGLTITVACGE